MKITLATTFSFCTLAFAPTLVSSQGCTILEVSLVDEMGNLVESQDQIYYLGSDDKVDFLATSICGSAVSVGGTHFANIQIREPDTFFAFSTNVFGTSPAVEYLAVGDFGCPRPLASGIYDVTMIQCFPDTNGVGNDPCIGVENPQIVTVVSGFGVKDFVFVDALTNQNITLSQVESTVTLVNLRAETYGSIGGSVSFSLTGPVTAQRTENVAPYALFGDSAGDYFGQILPSGTYKVTAQAFTLSGGGGNASEQASYSFTI